MQRFCHIAGFLFVTLAIVPAASAEPPRPRLDGRQPVVCVDDPNGVPVRVQCDTAATGRGVCWVAPACLQGMKDVSQSTCQSIPRVRWCDYGEKDYAALVAEHTVVAAVPDIEDGYWRDDEGRIFQIGFDLNQRFWLGARWRGTWHDAPGANDLDGFGLDMGLRVDFLDGDLKSKTRVRMLETDLGLSPLTLRARFLEIDTSNHGDDPFLRVTTFIGEPARHDLYVTAGWWGELAAVEHAPRGSDSDTFLRIIGGGITWDLWHDADMTSFLRLRGGVAIDDVLRKRRDAEIAITPLIYLEGDFTFDDRGFHHLRLSSGYEAVFVDEDGDGSLGAQRRFLNEVAYELVLIAVNDQPVTLFAAVNGGYRDDLTNSAKTGWELGAEAGLRFSIWAPPRDLDARDRAAQRLRERGQ